MVTIIHYKDNDNEDNEAKEDEDYVDHFMVMIITRTMRIMLTLIMKIKNYFDNNFCRKTGPIQITVQVKL